MPKLYDQEDQIIDLSNINPNKMLAFSFNYELLKYIITSLIRNQQNMESQLNDLKLSLLKQKNHSSQLEISILELKMQKEEDPDELDNLLNKKKELNSEKEKIEQSLQSLTKENEEEKNQKRIMPIYNMKQPKIEENLNEFTEEIITTDVENIQKNKIIDKNKDNENDNLDINKDKEIKENNNEEEENNKENNSKEEETNANEEKKEDVNTPRLPTSATITNNNEIEKIKNKNEDFHKELFLVVGELKNIKSKQQTLERDFSLFKTNTTGQLKEKLGNEIPSMIESAIENKINSIQKIIKRENNKTNEDINNLNNDLNQKISDLNNNITKQISLNEEKNNLELEQIKTNYQSIKENLSLINEKIGNMITTLTFNNFKKEINEKIENEKKVINLEISIIKNTLNNVKNQLNDHLYDSRDHDNLVSLMKIVDNISINIQKLLEFKKIFEEKDKRKAIVDNSKYVKQDGFNEAINNIHRSIDNNKKEFSEIRSDIDNIRTKDLNIKANLRDLKNLEDSIFTKMETLKETIRDNFVEKNMLVKNLKYLELQTKQLIEESKKKTEKQDSWILAKKPYNGHICASCESYIGDLKPNTNSKYVAWNKYPAKDPIEKIFRINAGFSKVLQMANQDNRNERTKSNSLNNSKEERYCSSAEGDKNRKMERIPNYKSGKSSLGRDKNIHNNSCTQIDDNDFPKVLPKILTQKSSSNILVDDSNKNKKNNNRKSRSLVEISDTKIKNIDENDNDNNNNKELQKPKINKIFRKFGETLDKKEDENKE